MWCVLVFYFVVTIFVDVYSLHELCVFENNVQKAAYCGRHDVEYILNFIPPISQNISFIDLLGQPLKQLPYNGFRNLSSQRSISTVRLPHCQISYVDAGAFLNLHNLSIIDLSHNNINHIDTTLFGDTKQIKVIAMQYNKIEILPNAIFQNLTQLEEVYLDHNQIRQVGKFSFKNTPSLRIIALNNNQIQFMNMLFKNNFDTLTNLSLYNNPWRCNCKLGQLYEFLIQFNQLNQQELVCEKPSILHGRNWKAISRDEFVCSSGDIISTQDSIITNTEPVITAELVVIKDTFAKLDKDEENTEKETITTYQKRKTVTDESFEKTVTERKPEIRIEKLNITQKPVIIDEKQITEVEEDTNRSEIRNSELVTAEPDTATEESNTEMEEPIITVEPAIEELTTITEPIKTPQKPVDDQIVTTPEISFTNYEEPDRNLEQFLKDLKWMPWTLFSVAMICLLIVAIAFGCATKYTFTSFKRKFLSKTDEQIEKTSGLIYIQTAQQENC